MRWFVVSIVLLTVILVPFVLFEETFNRAAERLIARDSSGWYTGSVIAALLASDVFLPIPSSIVAAAAGVALGFVWGSLATWTGMTLSCGLGYVFGAETAATARKFVGDAGMARAAHLATRYGDYALVLCRPIPVLAEASVILAGIVRRPVGRFLTLTMAANAGVAMGYAAIGAYSMRVDSFLLAFLGAIIVPAIAMLVGRLWLGAR